MAYSCKHFVEPYLGCFDMREPTSEKINEARLWQCPECGRWFSLVGSAKILCRVLLAR